MSEWFVVGVRLKVSKQGSTGGLPYMTSAVGGGRGDQKADKKKQNQLICDSDKVGGGQKI